ncbi:MAG: regulatory protein RecX [Candidatus Limnocylindria bacterium]
MTGGRRGRHPAAPTSPPDGAAALDIAGRFLATRPRTRWEVERRLRRAGASPEVVDATVEQLAALGYVDDAAFVRWWVEQRDRHAPRGRRMLEAELRQHGVPRDLIESLRDELTAPQRAPHEGGLPADDEARAREALARHLRGRPVPDDQKALQRLGAFLVRRGFDPETARRILRQAAARDDLVDDSP